MKTVVMRSIYASPSGTARIGDEIELEDEEAERLLESRQAVELSEYQENQENEEDQSTEEPESSPNNLNYEDLVQDELEERIANELAHAGNGWFTHDLLDESVRGQEQAIEAVKDVLREDEGN